MKIGIVGAGMISGLHLSGASSYPGAEIVGIVDREISRARAAAARFSVKRSFDNLAELLALKPDVVHVLTPPVSHEPVVLEALAGGAHIYVEKPMALSEAQCNTMTQAATAAHREICVGHCWLYTPAMLQAQKLLASGVAGEIVQASSSFNFDVRRNASFGQTHWAKELPGGLAEDLAVHPLSVLIRLLGAPQRSFAISRSASIVPGQTADVRALLEAERGLGSFAVSLRSLPDMASADIWCERMLLRLNISAMTMTVHRELAMPRKLARGLSNIDVAAQLVGATAGATWKLLRKKVDGSYGIIPLIHAFYAAIEAGRPAPVGAVEGTQSVRVLRSIWPAADGSGLSGSA